MVNNCAIIGLGLIGGSIAKALKKSSNKINIAAFDNNQSDLKNAFSEGTIDKILNSLDDAINYDLIFVCTPVNISKDIMAFLFDNAKEDSIVTDVCSVKATFEKIYDNSLSKPVYIGGHPMTGKEKGGYNNADHLLFENAIYILSDRFKETNQFNFLVELIKSLGARISVINPELHDQIVANVSHLPQLLSIALVNNGNYKEGNINFLDFAAGGFRDMTRIASSEFKLWKSIYENNKLPVIEALTNYINKLVDIKEDLINNNFSSLNHKFEQANIARDYIPQNTKGFINPLYDLYVYVNDEPGVISKISTPLSEAGINIKDIELLKIRVGFTGTFRLSFESESDRLSASQLLNKCGFETKIN